MKSAIVVASALLAGFVGGILSTAVTRSREQPRLAQAVRARSFELVNEAGEMISYWGVDSDQNVVLTFGSRGLSGGSAFRVGAPLNLRDADNQLTTIGLQGNDMPFLKMSGADKKTRVRLLLSQDGKPTLLMEDETGPRVSLGIEQSDTPGPDDNDWSLRFSPDIARIGLHAEKEDGKIYVRGGIFISPNKVRYPYQQPK